MARDRASRRRRGHRARRLAGRTRQLAWRQHSRAAKDKAPTRGAFIGLAEQVGFEPTVRHNRTPDFESGAFDHSATAPEFGSRGAKPVILAHHGRITAAPPM